MSIVAKLILPRLWRICLICCNILEHPNIKAFITHGGLLGTIEAIACGVPMIGIPLFADQFTNVDAYVARDIIVRLDIHKITVKDMDAALSAILHDLRYK